MTLYIPTHSLDGSLIVKHTLDFDQAHAKSVFNTRLASSDADLLEAQKLRHSVLMQKFGVSISHDGIDSDQFDAYCDHVLVIDETHQKVVGTYRILNSSAAKKLGQLYGELEFTGTLWHELGDQVVELGRACVHADYRTGATLMHLWQGIVNYLVTHQVRYAIGYASVGVSRDGADALATQSYLESKCPVWTGTRLIPKCAYPLDTTNLLGSTEKGDVPSLIKAYVRMGSYCVGDAAWDVDMQTADFPMLLDMAKLDKRYAKHFVAPKNLTTLN